MTHTVDKVKKNTTVYIQEYIYIAVLILSKETILKEILPKTALVLK